MILFAILPYHHITRITLLSTTTITFKMLSATDPDWLEYEAETANFDWDNLEWIYEDVPLTMRGDIAAITGASSAQDMAGAVTASLPQSGTTYQDGVGIVHALPTIIITEAPNSVDAQAKSTHTETEGILSTANAPGTLLTDSEADDLGGIFDLADYTQFWSFLLDTAAPKDDTDLSLPSLGSVDAGPAGVVPATTDQAVIDASEEPRTEGADALEELQISVDAPEEWHLVDTNDDETIVDITDDDETVVDITDDDEIIVNIECPESLDNVAEVAETEVESVDSADQDRHSAVDDDMSDIAEDSESDDEMDTTEAAGDAVSRGKPNVIIKIRDFFIKFKPGSNVRLGWQKAPQSHRVHKKSSKPRKVECSSHKTVQKRVCAASPRSRPVPCCS